MSENPLPPGCLAAPRALLDQSFEMRFTSTPRGARLARRLAAHRLDAWGIAYDTCAHDTIVLVVAELSANAVRHGHVPGRDFRLGLRVSPADGTVRVEVTDTRAERTARTGRPADTGRGRDGRPGAAPRRGARRALGLVPQG